MKTCGCTIVPTTLAEVCDPRTSAFIVYDMQVGIVGQLPDGKELVERAEELLEAARGARIRVFFTRHCWLPNRYAGIGQQRRAMVWQKKNDPEDTHVPFPIGSAPWQIVPELTPREDEVVIDKITMSCFAHTFLDLAMRDAGLVSFLIAGIALEVGIEPSVRHALDLNYVPLIVTDACGSRNAEVEQRSLATLRDTGEVLTSDTATIAHIMRSQAPTG